MSDWDFGSDKEVQDAVHATRQQRLSGDRFGEYAGGFIGVILAVAIALWHFFGIAWPHPQPVRLLMAYCGMCVGGLFAGAYLGKRFASKLKRTPQEKKEPPR